MSSRSKSSIMGVTRISLSIERDYIYGGCVQAAQRQASAAPLAASTDRHERWGATTPKDRAQLRGRASGVRCTQCWAASDEIIREKGS